MMCAQFLSRETERGQGSFSRGCRARLRRMRQRLRPRACAGCCATSSPTLLATLALIVLTGFFYVVIPKGFFPEQDTGFIFGAAEARQDISFEAMAKIEHQFASIIMRDPAVSGRRRLSPGDRRQRKRKHRADVHPAEAVRRARHRLQQVMQRLKPEVGAGHRRQVLHAGRAGHQRSAARLEQAQYQYTLTDTEFRRAQPLGADPARAKCRLCKILTDVASDQQIASPHIAIEVDRNAASRLGVADRRHRRDAR